MGAHDRPLAASRPQGDDTMTHLYAHLDRICEGQVRYGSGGVGVSGQVQIMNDPGASVLPQVRAGNAKVLGVAARKRSPLEPNVPTIAEQGAA